MGCSINKAGSTSLSRTFKDLRISIDHAHKEGHHKLPIKVNRHQLHKESDLYQKFVFVREPMERLASAYNDKMIVNPAHWLVHFREKVKDMAIDIKGESPGNLPSFDDFLIALVVPGEDEGNFLVFTCFS